MPSRKSSPSTDAEKQKTEAPSPITAEIADRLLRADLANIVRKVKSGRTLSTVERKTLEAAGKGDTPTAPTFAKNYVELAEILGVTRRTLQDWRKLEGAPKAESNGSHDVVAWQDFQTRIGGKGALEPTDADPVGGDLPSEPVLKRRKLLLFCQEKEMLLAYRRGELIERDLVRETWSRKCAEANSLLRKRLENELPSELEGLEAVDIYKALVAVVDEFNEAMSGGDTPTAPRPRLDDLGADDEGGDDE